MADKKQAFTGHCHFKRIGWLAMRGKPFAKRPAQNLFFLLLFYYEAGSSFNALFSSEFRSFNGFI